jgi:hypothetical protein
MHFLQLDENAFVPFRCVISGDTETRPRRWDGGMILCTDLTMVLELEHTPMDQVINLYKLPSLSFYIL